MKLKISVFICFLFCVLFFWRCEQDPLTYDCTGVSPTYTLHVKPVMDASCAISGCHSASSKAGKIDLSNYASVKSKAASNSFMGAMQHRKGYDKMAQGGAKLSDDILKTISCWIASGSPE